MPIAREKLTLEQVVEMMRQHSEQRARDREGFRKPEYPGAPGEQCPRCFMRVPTLKKHNCPRNHVYSLQQWRAQGLPV